MKNTLEAIWKWKWKQSEKTLKQLLNEKNWKDYELTFKLVGKWVCLEELTDFLFKLELK